MFERDREWRLRRNDADGREQCRDGQQIEQNKQDDREREPLSAAPGWIVKDLSISHGFALVGNGHPCQ